MAQLNIQVPDELAQRLEPIKERLPELLLQLIETINGVHKELLPKPTSVADLPSVYAEVLDFLVTRPTPKEILAFKASELAQEHLRSLLDKNREGTLTDAENAELDSCEQLEHLMILLKARAAASTK
jgi:hypothetical protein